MTVDNVVIALIVIAAPAQTAFILLYGLGSPWWRSLIGRALFTKALGLAAIVDLSLAYHWFGDNYFLRDPVRIGVFVVIAVGAWLQLTAFVKQRLERRRRLRQDLRS